MIDPEAPLTLELDKKKAVADKAEVMSDFLDWLRDKKGWMIMRPSVKRDWHSYHLDDPQGNELSDFGGMPVRETEEQILADFFGIDLEKMEAERREVLEWDRSRMQR